MSTNSFSFKADGVDLEGSEANAIRGKTIQKPSGHWLVGVDGFHQIHCLVSYLMPVDTKYSTPMLILAEYAPQGFAAGLLHYP